MKLMFKEGQYGNNMQNILTRRETGLQEMDYLFVHHINKYFLSAGIYQEK